MNQAEKNKKYEKFIRYSIFASSAALALYLLMVRK